MQITIAVSRKEALSCCDFTKRHLRINIKKTPIDLLLLMTLPEDLLGLEHLLKIQQFCPAEPSPRATSFVYTTTSHHTCVEMSTQAISTAVKLCPQYHVIESHTRSLAGSHTHSHTRSLAHNSQCADIDMLPQTHRNIRQMQTRIP